MWFSWLLDILYLVIGDKLFILKFVKNWCKSSQISHPDPLFVSDKLSSIHWLANNQIDEPFESRNNALRLILRWAWTSIPGLTQYNLFNSIGWPGDDQNWPPDKSLPTRFTDLWGKHFFYRTKSFDFGKSRLNTYVNMDLSVIYRL